jgi:hypothetical protein
MDIFIEKIVSRRKGPQDLLLTLGIVIGGFILTLIILNIPFLSSFALFFAVGIVYLVYRLITSRNIEFEYAVTNGELDIDKIISQRKRKRIFSASCKDFEVMARVKSSHYNHDVQNIKNKIDAASSIDSPDVFFATLHYKGERTVIFFEPDQRMVNAFKTYIPRKIFE